MGSLHTEVPSPGVPAFIGFVAQGKRRGISFSHPPFWFNPGGATGMQGIGFLLAEVC